MSRISAGAIQFASRITGGDFVFGISPFGAVAFESEILCSGNAGPGDEVRSLFILPASVTLYYHAYGNFLIIQVMPQAEVRPYGVRGCKTRAGALPVSMPVLRDDDARHRSAWFGTFRPDPPQHALR